MSKAKLKPVEWKAVVNHKGTLKDFIISATSSECAIKAACKLAEKLGGDYTDIVSVELIGDTKWQ